MPELPEVETMRRGIVSIVGLRIGDVRVPPSPLRPIIIDPPIDEFRRRIVGRTVLSVGRSGKRVLVELDSGERIVIEPRMTGRVLLKQPPDSKHLRLVFVMSNARCGASARRGSPDPAESVDRRSPDGPGRPSAVPGAGSGDPRTARQDPGGAQLLFWDSRGLGVVRLLTPEDFACRLGPAKLGPDALEITIEELRRRLSASRRAVKVALLDQGVLAGVGNLYASEILHRAKVHPAVPCNCVRPADWRRIHAAIQEVLQEAVTHQGSTLADGMYRTVQGEAGRYQEQHRVYQRTGELCRQCGKSKIVRIVQSQRSSFFCPNCQRPRRGIP